MSAVATTPLALLRLLQVSDSLFPSGSFAFSHGLETLAEERRVRSEADLEHMLRTQVLPRWAGVDRVFLAAAHGTAADLDALAEVDADCERHVAIAEAGEASRRTGQALLLTHARIGTPGAADYRARAAATGHGHAAVVQGLVGHALALPFAAVAAGALYGTVQASLGAAVRLGLIGAIAAQGLAARLAAPMADVLAAPLPARPGAFAPFADIAIARHRSHGGRLFAS